MKTKTGKTFTRGFLSAMTLLLIWACTSPEPIEEHTTNENIAQPKEVGVVKQWISNTTTNNIVISNVYALHQWDLAKATIINKSESDNFTLDIPLSFPVINSNYKVFARYIQLTNELKVRVFVKSKDILKDNKVNTNFVYPIDDADDFLKIPELANSKLDNHEFKDFYNNDDLALRYGGCGCNSGFWSSIWNAIANFGGSIWNGIRGVSNSIGSFFSNWGGSYSNYTSGNTGGGGYGLYEFEEILAGNEATGGGYQGWVQQELFYLPNTVTNGEMYHMREYGKAVSNLDLITGQITSAYPNVNKGELLNAIFKLHLHSNYHNDIYNGNLANVIDIVNFEDYVYDEHMWDLLQKFTHKFFYERANGTSLLTQALGSSSNYEKRVLLTALGFNANYVINTFSEQQLDWMANNPETGKQIANFLNQNSTGYGYSNEAKNFASDFVETTLLTQTQNLPAMQRLITFMRQYGESEHEIIADYYDSIIEEYDNMTESEKQFIHGQLVEIKNDILWAYVNAIVGTIVTDLVIPVVSYALFEAGGSFAIKLLQKIPLPAVLVGTRLNNLIIKTTQLGNPGVLNSRLIPNSTAAKAEALFTGLTKNASSIVPAANNPAIKVAHMGNGAKIILRPTSTTVPEAVSVIEYQNFNSLLGTSSYTLKFIP